MNKSNLKGTNLDSDNPVDNDINVVSGQESVALNTSAKMFLNGLQPSNSNNYKSFSDYPIVGSRSNTKSAGLQVQNANTGLCDIAYGNGLWAGILRNSAVYSSTDAITWVSRSAFSGATAINYGNGTWFAVKDGSLPLYMLTSTDGITWTTSSTAVRAEVGCLKYNNNVWRAASQTTMSSSTDGVTWTTSGLPTSNLRCLFYGNNVWIYGDLFGSVYSSTDGISWSVRKGAGGNTYGSGAYGNGMYVVPRAGGDLLISTDGISWTTRVSPRTNLFKSYFTSVAYGNGLWVLATSNYICVSDNNLLSFFYYFPTYIGSFDGSAGVTFNSNDNSFAFSGGYSDGKIRSLPATFNNVTTWFLP